MAKFNTGDKVSLGDFTIERYDSTWGTHVLRAKNGSVLAVSDGVYDMTLVERAPMPKPEPTTVLLMKSGANRGFKYVVTGTDEMRYISADGSTTRSSDYTWSKLATQPDLFEVLG